MAPVGYVKCPQTGHFVPRGIIFPTSPTKTRSATPGPPSKGKVKPQNQEIVQPSAAFPQPAARVLPDPLPARAKGEGKGNRPSSSRKASDGWWKKVKLPSYSKISKSAGQLFTLFTLLATGVVFTGHEGPLHQVSRVLSSAALVSESAGRAASLVLDRGADFTALATSAVLAVTTTSLGAV